jgi:hypothetical protein
MYGRLKIPTPIIVPVKTARAFKNLKKSIKNLCLL